MKLQILEEIIQKKYSNKKFALLTNLMNGNSEIFELGKILGNDFINYKKQIENFHNFEKNGVIDGSQIFVQNYSKLLLYFLNFHSLIKLLVDLFHFLLLLIHKKKYFHNLHH